VKGKLILLVLLLVVLPTAILTLMAGLALRDWEAVVQQRLRDSAYSVLQGVASRLNSALDREAEEVAAAMADAVARGAAVAALDEVNGRVCEARPLVAQTYLFMNPWGFLYPPELAAARQDGDAALTADDALPVALRREIASGREGQSDYRFRAGEDRYCFRALPTGALYVGFRVRREEWQRRLWQAVRSASSGGLAVLAEGPGLAGVAEAGREAAGGVLLSDSFGVQEPRPAAEADGEVAGGQPLAETRLRPPCEETRLYALLRNPDEAWMAGARRGRLVGWGVALLAAGILAGAWLVLREATREIERVRARSDFVMGLSHDLRTPVSGMKVLAESLYLDTVTDPEKRKRFLGAIVRECERLNQMVERVLFFVRFGQGALAYGSQPLDAGALVAEAVQRFCALAADSGAAAVRLETEAGAPRVRGDESALAQVVFNLLDNAAKYGRPEKGDAPCETRVTVDTVTRRRRPWSRRRRWVRLGVHDRGPGLTAREARRIFSRFYRTPSARRRNVSGAGLGLALCRHVAAAHGGWIEVRSRPGMGSSFFVFLPAAEEAT